MDKPQITDFTESVKAGSDLSLDDAVSLAVCLADESVSDEAKRACLLALHEKGETADEVAGIARHFRSLATDPELGDFASRAIDIVGTGGDGFGSFNISTTAALIVAAAGVPVIKHGNRSVTSKCGSADFLEALGVKLEAPKSLLNRAMEEAGFCFLFAPHFHPAFRAIMPVRKQLAAEGKRTLFNLLGPLLNPAQPAFQVLGVYHQRWLAPIAGALDANGLKCGLVVHCTLEGDEVMDELSTAGTNQVYGVGQLHGMQVHWEPEDLQLAGCHPSQLKGGDTARNVEIFERLMAGSASAGLEDTVCLNAGAGLWASNRVDTLVDGVEYARDVLTDGTLANWLKTLKRCYAS